MPTAGGNITSTPYVRVIIQFIKQAHRELLAERDPVLHVASQFFAHGQIADPLSDLHIIRLVVFIQVTQLLHHAAHVPKFAVDLARQGFQLALEVHTSLKPRLKVRQNMSRFLKIPDHFHQVDRSRLGMD